MARRNLTRRTVLRGFGVAGAVAGAAAVAPGCVVDMVCHQGWNGAGSQTCFDHAFRPGDLVCYGTAQQGETVRQVRDRVAQRYLTPGQQVVVFGLLTYTVGTDEVERTVTTADDPEAELVFEGGEVVRFYLADIVLVAGADGDGQELDQFQLFDAEFIGGAGEAPEHMAFLAIRDGRVHLPDESEFTIHHAGTADEVWHYTPQQGDERLVFVDVGYVNA